MILHFRQATRADLPAMIALLATDTIPENREDASEPLDPAYPAAFDAITANPDHQLIVAERDGAIVGTLQLSFLPGLAFRGRWRCQIESVRVAPELRGQGIGAAMIDHALGLARARGCFMAQLTSSNSRDRAHKFYEKLGWKRSHYGFKIDLAN